MTIACQRLPAPSGMHQSNGVPEQNPQQIWTGAPDSKVLRIGDPKPYTLDFDGWPRSGQACSVAPACQE